LANRLEGFNIESFKGEVSMYMIKSTVEMGFVFFFCYKIQWN